MLQTDLKVFDSGLERLFEKKIRGIYYEQCSSMLSWPVYNVVAVALY